ncbi:hypothetical protein ACLQ3C_02425 [Gordonia sp. DT30]|uniref:hypothetical protein n=1 Tax=unclassified Gordonia (in: high G+C Gram-positive bacteria) TaxID=2657482 RepID=UPI003CEFBBCB
MPSSYLKSRRKCPSCGANLHVRKDVTESSSGSRRVDTTLVCRDEGCSEPSRHLHTEHLQPA